MSLAMSRVAVFLDRDGVLNQATTRGGRPHPPQTASELTVLPGVVHACHDLRGAGYLLVVVSNQPDIARGTATMEDVEAINARLRAEVPLDDLLFCPHDDGDDCACRKPQPGLLRLAARRWDIDLRRSVLIGDRWKDIEAGRRAGCATVLVDRGYAEQAAEAPDLVVRELSEAVPWILATHQLTEEERAYANPA